jgi:predicted N-acetyltransferase YhbS
MTALAAPALPTLVNERPEDAAAVEALIARAFGPGRFAKAAERLREGGRPILALSFVAWEGGTAVGCVRLWPVTVGATKALLLGPFAVDAEYRGQGLGAALIERACAAAGKAGHDLVVLVGDEAYFGPLGFTAAPVRRIVLPGPVDQRRVLARSLKPGVPPDLAGPVRAAP